MITCGGQCSGFRTPQRLPLSMQIKKKWAALLGEPICHSWLVDLANKPVARITFRLAARMAGWKCHRHIFTRFAKTCLVNKPDRESFGGSLDDASDYRVRAAGAPRFKDGFALARLLRWTAVRS